jgi:2-oxoisovalerate dehydrogenase E2 component (dihydrolipoyl transacylase)
VLKLHYETGAIAKVGTPLVDIDVEGGEAEESGGSEPAEQKSPHNVSENHTITSPAEAVNDKKTFATPAVRRIAKENNINISKVNGTGPAGRVLKGDVLNYMKSPSVAEKTLPATASSSAPVAAAKEEQLVPLTMIQKAMFKSMTKSLTIPHFGFSDEIIMNNTTKLRKTINAHLGAQNSKISYMPIFLKTLSEALKMYPILNAKVIEQDGTPMLLYRSQHNIGIAVDSPQGFIVG